MYKTLGTPRHANESVDYRAKCDDTDCTTSVRVKVQPGYNIANTLRDQDWLVRDQTPGTTRIYCPDHASEYETEEDREARRKRRKRRS